MLLASRLCYTPVKRLHWPFQKTPKQSADLCPLKDSKTISRRMALSKTPKQSADVCRKNSTTIGRLMACSKDSIQSAE